MFLKQQHRFSDPLKLFACHKRSDCLLHHNAARFQLLVAYFFQIGHLTGSEEDFRLSELVLIRIFNVLSQDVLASFLHVVPVDVAQFAQDPVAVEEFDVVPSAGET